MLNPITLEPIPTQFEEAAALNMAVYADYYKRLRPWNLRTGRSVHGLDDTD